MTGYNYKYFVQEHNLEFLRVLFWLLTLGGLLIALVHKDKVKKVVDRFRKRQERKENSAKE